MDSLKVPAIILMTLTFILHALATFLPYWLQIGAGLLYACSRGQCISYTDAAERSQSQIVTVGALIINVMGAGAVISLLLNGTALLLLSLFCCSNEGPGKLTAAMVLNILAGIGILTVVGMWAGFTDISLLIQIYGASFWIAIAAGILSFICAGLNSNLRTRWMQANTQPPQTYTYAPHATVMPIPQQGYVPQQGYAYPATTQGMEMMGTPEQGFTNPLAIQGMETKGATEGNYYSY